MEQKETKLKKSFDKMYDFLTKVYDFLTKWYTYVIPYATCLIGLIILFSCMGAYQIPAYSESTYQHLEHELQNIIVENDDVYIEKLHDGIIYSIEYKESSTSEGQYEIVLEKGTCNITATIGKELNKEQLVIERNYENSDQYIKKQYITLIVGTLLLPAMVVAILALVVWCVMIILCLIQLIGEKLFH